MRSRSNSSRKHYSFLGNIGNIVNRYFFCNRLTNVKVNFVEFIKLVKLCHEVKSFPGSSAHSQKFAKQFFDAMSQLE